MNAPLFLILSVAMAAEPEGDGEGTPASWGAEALPADAAVEEDTEAPSTSPEEPTDEPTSEEAPAADWEAAAAPVETIPEDWDPELLDEPAAPPAAEPAAPPLSERVTQHMEANGPSLSLRLMGESWEDSVIAGVYRENAMGGSVGVSLPVLPGLGLEAEVGYKKLAGVGLIADTLELGDGKATLQLIPMSLLLEHRRPLVGGELYVAGGLAAVAFHEVHSTREDSAAEGSKSTQGGRVGWEWRLGMRHDIGLGLPVAPLPGKQAGYEAMFVEVYGGRRGERGRDSGEGYVLSAWRAGVGVGVRL